MASIAPAAAEPGKPELDKLSNPLRSVVAAMSRGGLPAARADAWTRGLDVDVHDRVRVLLEPRVAPSAVDRARLAALDARVETTSRSWVRVSVPVARLAELAALPDVVEVIEPATPWVETTEGYGTRVSEAVAITGADAWQLDGWTGAGVRVAVIDLGFSGLAAAKAAGEIPADAIGVDLTGLGLESGGVHGTGVAEHVVDMAPDVELYLIKVGDQADLQNAVAYLRTHDIDIANHSVGWVNASYYDDLGPLSAMVNASSEVDGVFWTVAAGNSARRHWRGAWRDDDGDGWLEFAPGDEGLGLTTASSKACVYLNWNQYGSSLTNLDLFARRSNGTQVASSVGLQGGTKKPAESFCFTYVSADAPYTLAVKLVSGPTSGLDMTLFSFNNELEHALAASSLMDPAAARGAFSVGAVNQSRWNDAAPPAETFSSKGPTNDGRMKPDIAGPDGTTSYTYGTRGAYGTSFSAPTTAGAAALLLSRDPSLDPLALAAALRGDARDVGAVGIDTTFGSGLLELALAPVGSPAPNTPPVARPDSAVTSEDTAVITSVLANDTDADGDTLVLGALGTVVNGTLGKSGTSAVKFTPNANWSGTTSYSYTVTDGRGGVATGLVSVSVSPVNDAPIAVADSATALAGQTTSIPVLVNDVDLEGDALTVRIVSPPTVGVAIVVGEAIAFTPPSAFLGTITFTYEAVDPSGATGRATVTVSVVAPTAPPVIGGAPLASDSFDGGTTSGGAGWSGGWSLGGYALLTDVDAPSSAPWHLRLRANNGLAQRTMSGAATSLRLVFRAKVSDFESGDTAVVKVSIDGGLTWKIVQTFTSAQSDGIYRTYDIALSAFGAGSASGLRVAFDANMNASTDYWYVDDVQLFGTR